MYRISIAVFGCLLFIACSKPQPYTCTCAKGTANEEVHFLDADFNPDELTAACEMFQTVDSNDQVIVACEVTE